MFNNPMTTIFTNIILCLSLLSCSNSNNSSSSSISTSSSGEPASTSYKWGSNENLFAENELMRVDISMADNDWNRMRYDGPQISDWGPACVFEGYPKYKASVVINDESVSNVDIRKKGWIGSVTALRPSLKLNFGGDDTSEEENFHGHKRITLNNNRQDPSNIKQCLSYFLFEKAGVPAPKCNFASVRLQGKDLGIYTHVEEIKKPFLKRVFNNDDGNLYELQRDGEFDSTHINFFKLKTNEDKNDRSDIEAVVSALNLPDNEVMAALNKIINLEQFILFSAMEALIGHTDGYNGYQNNTYIYHNTDDHRLYFIPWGTDQAFDRNHVYPKGTVPASVLLGSKLMKRLFPLPEFQAAYEAQMRTLLATVWDENSIKAELKRMSELLGTPDSKTLLTHSFIDRQRQLILAELSGNTFIDWPWDLISDFASCPPTTAISGTFDIAFNQESAPSKNVSITYNNVTYSNEERLKNTIEKIGSQYRISLSAASPNQQLSVSFSIPQEFWLEGLIPLHSLETTGYLTATNANNIWEYQGPLSDGGITILSAALSKGRIQGHFEAVVVAPY